jgi:4-amino-4-deoxy-L-arabinose transferase-like glycosyltransferase
MSATLATNVDWLRLLVRPGQNGSDDVRRDVLWLLGFGLLLIATGLGVRDPWPADEPRFALIARDMVATGHWLVPRVGGEVYADKPPLYFWIMALGIQLTGSLKFAFLLPSLASGLACVFLVYDLARRLWNRETALLAGLALLFTAQFVWQARQAQIDATLCFWTTLGLYGLLRHLLLGPRWGWYVTGWAAAGFGVITKGVGFLPLLVLLPYAALRAPVWQPRFRAPATFKWLLGPAAFAIAAAVWLVPMLIVANADPAIAAYRDEILFRQTMDRYTNAWHHREPFWYFLIEVIPWLWLPLTALLPWLVREWRQSLRAHDLRVALLLLWVALVVVFFSLSTGKRGVYVLPAVPALALVSAPYLRSIAARVAAQRVLFGITALLAVVASLAVPYLLLRTDKRTDLIEAYGLDPLAPLVAIAAIAIIAGLICRARRGFLAYAGVLVCVLLVVSYWVNPAMNDARSGRMFMARVERAADPAAPLGFVAFKEQYLLHATRSIVHFGHARWRESEQETMDAARWLSESPERQLVLNDASLEMCFPNASRMALGKANRNQWFLVRGSVEPECIEGGTPGVAYFYYPPANNRGDDGATIPLTMKPLSSASNE